MILSSTRATYKIDPETTLIVDRGSAGDITHITLAEYTGGTASYLTFSAEKWKTITWALDEMLKGEEGDRAVRTQEVLSQRAE